MAYEAQGINAVKNTAKLDIGGQRTSLDGFINILENQPAVPNKTKDAGSIGNGTSTSFITTPKKSSKNKKQPTDVKPQFVSANVMDNSMSKTGAAQRGYVFTKIDLNKPELKGNPFLRQYS